MAVQLFWLIEQLFIPSAASDRGQAMGCALAAFHQLTGTFPNQTFSTDYLGKQYSEYDIDAAFSRTQGLVEKFIPTKNFYVEKQSSITTTTAKLIAEGKIVAWFEGRSELGPRALGHRSILCDPRNPNMKKTLNHRVKHRESFRPFAPSCLLEEAQNYFEILDKSPFMLLTPKVRSNKESLIPAIIHKDKTARLQTVTNDNGRFYGLIKKFFTITGIPMLLNTSFNDQSPMVETPGDAISVFLKTDIDFLIIENYLISK